MGRKVFSKLEWHIGKLVGTACLNTADFFIVNKIAKFIIPNLIIKYFMQSQNKEKNK